MSDRPRGPRVQGCPACAQRQTDVFCRLPEQPVLSNVLCQSPAQARALRRGPISLALCRSCGLIFNADFDPGQIGYGGHYENALHFSPRFQAFVRELSQYLVTYYDLRGKYIVEVGCGDGQFLSALCKLGGSRGRGYDPSHEPGRAAISGRGNVAIVSDVLDDDADEAADMLVCRHVLEHVFEPGSFLESLLPHLRRGAGVYFEVPDTMRSLRDNAIWDIIYEHCLYFTAAPLRRLFVATGFTVEEVSSRYDGQFLSLQGSASTPSTEPEVDPADLDELERLTQRFAQHHRRNTSFWQDRLETEKRAGKTVVLWGAGSKGSAFLNRLDRDAKAVAAAVDLNPRLHGSFVGGTGHPIVAPEALADLEPATVIVANPIYQTEIVRQLEGLGLDCRLAMLGTKPSQTRDDT